MGTTKETIKVIAEGVEGHKECPVIENIARRVSDYYDEAEEFYLEGS